MIRPRVREELAAYAHEAWAGWIGYMFRRGERHPDGSLTLPAESVARWDRQCATDYPDLPPEEQESDLAEADRILHIVAGD